MPQQQPSDVSMRDLLASCAAANAVSTPPRPAAVGTADRTEGDDPTEGGDGGDEAAHTHARREGERHEAPRAA
ncbi:hypothetical protein [Streptomyces sp. TRM49041]|uniref:hypothetical protein n=1 Tax=Streptomyces sp. TRM49041 TaxID=2603216 RepID=UPI0011EE6217|nr:hypothetical protein [Streptomyces sp. TRM49041]